MLLCLCVFLCAAFLCVCACVWINAYVLIAGSGFEGVGGIEDAIRLCVLIKDVESG